VYSYKCHSSINSLRNAWRAGICVGMMLFFWCAGAAAQSSPGVVLSQIQWLAAFPSGRALESADAAGTSFAVNSDGNILISDTYGNEVLLVNGHTGKVTVLATLASGYGYGVGAVTVDQNNNLYISGLYEPYIAKVPYVNGTYAPINTPTRATPICTGNDTTECLWGSNLAYSGNGYWYGVLSMTFDAAGNFYFSTNGTGTLNPFSIYECSGACMISAETGVGNAPPTLLYKEPAATPSTVVANAQGVDCAANGSMVQETPGGLAVDSWGDLFFTESALDNCGAANGEINQSDSSSLREIATRAGPPYSAPILYTLVPANPGSYDDELDAVAVDSNGTVYFTAQDDGVFAFADTGILFTTTPSGIYTVAATGSKVLAVDGTGSLYVVSSLPPGNSGTFVDTLGRVSVNRLTVPPSAVDQASGASASVNVIDNASNCASHPAFTFTATEDGQPTREFAGETTGDCEADLFHHAVFPAAIQAEPAFVGGRSALISVEDSFGNSGEAIASTAGEGAEVALDPGRATMAYMGFSNPAAVAVDGAGNIFVADASANTVDEIAAGTNTAVVIGSGFKSPSGVAVDANGNLFVADSANDRIVEIADPNGAQKQSTVVAASTVIGGMTLNDPTALAIGPDGVVYALDAANGRVVTYNPRNGLTGVRVWGLEQPQGMTVDSAGNLYISRGDGGSGIIEIYAASGRSTVTLAGVTSPEGLAVEPSGAVLVVDQQTGRIVRIPMENGVLAASDAIAIEANPVSAGGLALQANGDLYATDPSDGKIYWIVRNGAALDFGSVEDGSSSAILAVNAENIGNQEMMPAPGAGNFVTAPRSNLFALENGSPTDCLTATSLSVGEACSFAAQFAPFPGTPAGAVSATVEFESTAVNAPAAITLSGIAVPAPAAEPSFAPPPGNYTDAQWVTIADATADAPIYYTTDGSMPSTASQLYTGPIQVTSSETIRAAALAPGYSLSSVASASYTISPLPPSFRLSLNPSTIDMEVAGESQADITITPVNNFQGIVTFHCSGLPIGTACEFAPSAANINGTSPVTVMLTVSGSFAAAGRQDSNHLYSRASVLACGSLLLVGIRRRRYLRKRWLMLGCVLTLGISMTGCGTVLNNPHSTSTVTVTAASGAEQQQATFTLIT
jgi:sugar lactone lactonase YvrE